MITRDFVKAEIDKIQDRYLGTLYHVIKSLAGSPDLATATPPKANASWHQFIEETYGCLADAPIERGEQGTYEIREVIE